MEDMLNPKEQEAVEELKRRLDSQLTQEQKDDTELFIRFLRARDFQINLAEDMLKKHISWRNANNIDKILTDYQPSEMVSKYVPLTLVGFDKEGSPVRYFDFGGMDLKGLLKTCRKTDLVKYLVYCFETDAKTMKEQNKKFGRSASQWTFIVNFENFNLSKATHKPTIEFLLHLFQVYEPNYPERLKAAFMISTSIYFSMVYAIVKPLMSAATTRKILIYGKDNWKSDVLQSVEPEILPAFLCGKRTDPDGNPMCRTFIKHAEPVPDEYCVSKLENRVRDKEGAQRLFVSRMAKAHLPVEIEEPGSIIDWEFETENRDINFGLCYKEDTKNSTELIPYQKIDAHVSVETGMYKCDKPGIYVLVFDNSYSWIHRKEIFCKVSVLPPVKTYDR